MQNKKPGYFATRNALIPLTKLEASPFKPDGFVLGPLQAQIEAEGLSVHNFYFDPHDLHSPYYYYYRGLVLLSWSNIDRQLATIKEEIGDVERRMNTSAARRDFEALLAAVDHRLAQEVYMEVFHLIPDQDKYRLFESLWLNNQCWPEIFDEEFIAKVAKYRGVTKAMPAADEEGYVLVYRCGNPQEDGPELVSTWTTDINISISQALLSGKTQPIYQGWVLREHIVSYDCTRSKQEVRVAGDKVERLEPLPLINLGELVPILTEAGIIRQYQDYADRIDSRWFISPQGVHGVCHTRRVLLLSLTIAYLEQFDRCDMNLLGLASIYHDIGRIDDGYDPDHGIASYAKMIQSQMSAVGEGEEREMLRFIIENHAVLDQKARQKLDQYQIGDRAKTWRLYNAFKDADGLDRVRLNNLKPQYLRTASSRRLLMAAHQLYRQYQ